MKVKKYINEYCATSELGMEEVKSALSKVKQETIDYSIFERTLVPIEAQIGFLTFFVILGMFVGFGGLWNEMDGLRSSLEKISVENDSIKFSRTIQNITTDPEPNDDSNRYDPMNFLGCDI